MKRDEQSILHAELSEAIGRLGHTDLLMVVDAGFPIPDDVQRIDLALTRGIPTLEEVLTIIHQELIPERIQYADSVPEMNPDYNEFLQSLYSGSGADIETIPHEEVLASGHEAKAIVRTGDFVPWGNVVIHCGTDPKPWFDGENEVMPPDYRERYRTMYGEDP